jgi:2-C-methyl-D-erythritol 2,4-cyclodiphosphate synthase
MTIEQLDQAIRIGHGFDVHRFAAAAADDASIMLGGVNIPHTHSLLAHSDGDVAYHAICDALLGAIAAGDIGRHFPDTDPQYKNASSALLLQSVYQQVIAAGYQLGNLDVTLVAQTPKLASYIQNMCDITTAHLGVTSGSINFKATTTEQLGYVGREQGIAAHAVVIVYKSA